MTSSSPVWIDAERGARGIDARFVDERALVEPAALEAASGWALKPEGLCRGSVCVPVRDRDALVVGDAIDIEAFAAAVGRPVVIDVAEGVIALGVPAAERVAAMESLDAPDFELP